MVKVLAMIPAGNSSLMQILEMCRQHSTSAMMVASKFAQISNLAHESAKIDLEKRFLIFQGTPL
jgi:hypothetical protein